MVDNSLTSLEHHTDDDIGYYTNCSKQGTVPGLSNKYLTDVKIEPEAHALARADRLLTRSGSVFMVIGAVKTCCLVCNQLIDFPHRLPYPLGKGRE